MHTIEIGGRTLPVRPANLKSVKRWLSAQKDIRVGTPEYLDEVTAFIHATLARATPDITVDWLDEHLDEHNIGTIIAKIYEAGRIGSGEAQRPQNP